MIVQSDPQISHIYGLKHGRVCHLYLDERRMQKRLVNLRSDGSQVVYKIPFARLATLAAEAFFGFLGAVEIRDPDSEYGQQIISDLEVIARGDLYGPSADVTDASGKEDIEERSDG